MPRRLFITGITGFAGSHVAEAALARGDLVFGLAFEPPPHRTLAAVIDRVSLHHGDIADVEGVRRAIAASAPDAVVHLAAQAVPSLAEEDPSAAIRVNVAGTAAVVSAVRSLPGVALVLASSAEVYGVPERLPATEDTPVRPPNVYAATKVAAEAIARDLGDAGANPVVILRPVNQLGPRLHPMLVASALAKQIAEAEVAMLTEVAARGAASQAVIRHGRLDARRDFLDVRDMAQAYLAATDLALAGGSSGGEASRWLFNVGTGALVPISHILDVLVGLARVPVRTELDPERVRAGDPAAFTVDASRFRARTGWAPRTPLERSLADVLDHWRAVLGADRALRAVASLGGARE